MSFATQINPTCGTYVLQSHLIFLLKISRDLESFISFGKMSHIFGAKKETISLSLLFVSLERYSLVNCNCCFFPQKFHSLEVGKALVRICVFLLLEFSYFYGVLCDRGFLLKQVLERWWLAIKCDFQCSFVYSIYFIVKASTMEHPN